MNLLALDTSSIACSVAVQVGEIVVGQHAEKPREHTRLLLPMIRQALQEAEINLQDVDAVVLGNGPGSFIGMRIAASVAQGSAHGIGVDIIAVSSLAAIATKVFANSAAEEAVVAQDAHMGEVYLGVYARGQDDIACATIAERIHGMSVIEELLPAKAGSRVAAGCAWTQYRELAESNAHLFSASSGNLYPDARYVLRLATSQKARRPADIEPVYLRHQVAEIPSVRKP